MITFNINDKWQEDTDLRNSLLYFLQFIDGQYWTTTKTKIKDQIENKFLPNLKQPVITSTETKLLFQEDVLCWYLFLVDAYLTHPQDYEFAQGSRVIPIFKTIGKYINLLTTIGGVEDKIEKLVNNEKKNPDGLLFELIIALLYKRNGWLNVEFIPENDGIKNSDIHVSNDQKEYFVECKRLSKSSDYSINEHDKWLSMWVDLSDYLKRYRKPFLFDFSFHKELQDVEDNYLRVFLIPKLNFVHTSGILIDNEIVTINLYILDIDQINTAFENNDLKLNSASFQQVITGKYQPDKGVSFVVEGRKSSYHPSYLSEISFISGAVWICDSDEAIRKKARYIKRQLSEATSQLPDNKPSIVHIGLEELDGHFVELQRYERIKESIFNFSSYTKDLQWIFCHIFDPKAPPDKNWDFGEKVHYFSKYHRAKPIEKILAVVDE